MDWRALGKDEGEGDMLSWDGGDRVDMESSWDLIFIIGWTRCDRNRNLIVTNWEDGVPRAGPGVLESSAGQHG